MSEKYEIRINPADFSVLTSAIFTIAREMGLNMERTARAPIYFSAHDFCTSLLNMDAEIVALAEYIPVLVGATPFAVRAIKSYFGNDINPGDVFLVNDPYTLDGGNQLADWCIVYPVFYEEEQVLWVANKAHQQDTGGGAPGGYNPHAIDIYAEGLRIPPLRIYKQGRERRSVVNLIMTNVRIPEVQYSDMLSLIGAARVAEKRIHKLIDSYGKKVFEIFLEDLLAYGEFLTREEISKIPDGVYHSEITGEVEGAPPIVCDLTVKGDELTVDFTKSGPMSREYINSPIANTYSSVYQAILQSIGKRLEVRCGGCYRPITILTTPGTITHATYPATHGNCTNFVAKQIIESVWAALAQVAPHETPGGWGSIPYWVFSGLDPRRGEGYGSPDFLACASGAGAMWGVDGWSTNGPVICAGTLYYPEVEVCEGLYPITWRRWEWAADSAGPGRWRGGLGVKNEWVVNDGAQVFLHYAADPYDYIPAPAIDGGMKPPPNTKELVLSDGQLVSNQQVRDTKAFVATPGTRVIDFVQGGCGVGDPWEREAEALREDVRDGLVSIESAGKDYGVVINPDNFEIDAQRTKYLRANAKKGPQGSTASKL